MLRFTFHRSPLISRSPLEQRNHARRNRPRTQRIPTVLWRGTSSAAQAIDQRPLLRACGTDREWRRTQRRQARQRVRGRIDRAESAAAQSLRNRSAVISGGPLNHADGRPCSGNDLVGDISGKRIGRVRVQVRPDRVRCHAPSGQTGHVQHLSIRNGIPLTHSASALPQLQRHGNDPADVARCLRYDLFIHGDEFSTAQPYMSTPPKPAVCAAIYHCSMNIGARGSAPDHEVPTLRRTHPRRSQALQALWAGRYSTTNGCLPKVPTNDKDDQGRMRLLLCAASIRLLWLHWSDR